MLDDPLMRLFSRVKAAQEAEDQKIAAIAAHIGHNGGPALSQPFGIGAPWLGHATEDELARLALLHTRIERRKLILSETIGERSLIMNRCIRRMRRAAGKD